MNDEPSDKFDEQELARLARDIGQPLPEGFEEAVFARIRQQERDLPFLPPVEGEKRQDTPGQPSVPKLPPLAKEQGDKGIPKLPPLTPPKDKPKDRDRGREID